ncbi:hypothetical protein GN956_G17018 [Arapaima gigas]
MRTRETEKRKTSQFNADSHPNPGDPLDRIQWRQTPVRMKRVDVQLTASSEQMNRVLRRNGNEGIQWAHRIPATKTPPFMPNAVVPSDDPWRGMLGYKY